MLRINKGKWFHFVIEIGYISPWVSRVSSDMHHHTRTPPGTCDRAYTHNCNCGMLSLLLFQLCFPTRQLGKDRLRIRIIHHRCFHLTLRSKGQRSDTAGHDSFHLKNAGQDSGSQGLSWHWCLGMRSFILALFWGGGFGRIEPTESVNPQVSIYLVPEFMIGIGTLSQSLSQYL